MWETEVDEYQPLKWASDANGDFILVWLYSIHLPNNWWQCSKHLQNLNQVLFDLKVVWNNTKNYNMLHKISRFLKIHFSDNNKNPTGKLSLTPSSMSSSCQMDVWALMCGVVWHPSSSPSCYWHAWPDLDLGMVIHMWTNIGGPLLATAPCESHLQKELPLSVLLRGLWASTYP